MAKNEFLPFGTAANANVLSNADYQVLPARSSGFASGVAKSEQLNKAWRQATVMASVLGQFIADVSGNDVLDDGNTATLKNSLIAALNTQATGRLQNVKTFSVSGTYIPTPGTKKIRVKVWGAGGGGAGMSSAANVSVAGAAGAYAESFIDAGGITSLAVSVGAGGSNAAADASVAGGAGGTSTFGTLITCTGGAGGGLSGGVSNGGVATGGSIFNLNGQSGQGGSYVASVNIISSGVGGAPFSGSNSQPHSSTSGDSGSFPGGGGAMGVYISSTINTASGKGGNGFVIVEEYS